MPSRREFVRLCTPAAASVGLGPLAAQRFLEAAARGVKPSVIWLQFRECTGSTESLLRTAHQAGDDPIFDLISLEYHETLFAAAGHQAEAALEQAMRTNHGKYVCVVEGAIPTWENGIYCMIGGRTALDIVQDVAGQAGAVIVIGSCASWGGIPSADPNPTGAVGAHEVLKGKTVVNIPGWPANPYNVLGTVLQYATYGTLPALDSENRPRFAYGSTIHEHRPRRAHVDAGRFAEKYGSGVTDYLAVPDLPTDTKGTQFDLPGGTIFNGDLTSVKTIASFEDPYFQKNVSECITHAWYEGDWTRHPWDEDTVPHYTPYEADKKCSWIKAPCFDGHPMQVGPLAQVLVGFAQGLDIAGAEISRVRAL